MKPLVRLGGLLLRLSGEWLVVVLLFGSLALNVYLGLTLLKVRRAGQEFPFTVGRKAPALRANDAIGNVVTVHWATGREKSLLYIFSPTCVWCQRNLGSFEEVVQARHSDLRIIGLSITTEGLKAYIQNNGSGYQVLAGAASLTDRSYLEAGTPTTILISADGRIEATWIGAYDSRAKAEVESRLGLQFKAKPKETVGRPE